MRYNLTYVAAALIPLGLSLTQPNYECTKTITYAGNAEFPSALRTPSALSTCAKKIEYRQSNKFTIYRLPCKQKPGNPMVGAEKVAPVQLATEVRTSRIHRALYTTYL
jgi:hypothetical protein